MRSLFLLLLLLLASHAAAQGVSQSVVTIEDANAVLEEAHRSFERGEQRHAMDLYVRVADSGFASPTVWSNAGTAAYRAGDVGRAVLFYSRALQLDPNYDRALRSLEFISPATNAHSSARRDAIRGLLLRTSPVLWFVVGQGLFLLFCFAFGKAIGAADRERRGHWIAVLAWSAVFAVIFAAVGALNHHLRVSGADAVILVDGAIARSEPRAESTGQLELPAGTIVEILETRSNFARVRLADGSGGFVPTDQLDSI